MGSKGENPSSTEKEIKMKKSNSLTQTKEIPSYRRLCFFFFLNCTLIIYFLNKIFLYLFTLIVQTLEKLNLT